jgi:dihydroorotate dehydrogenase (NAD+) catalytic subunit
MTRVSLEVFLGKLHLRNPTLLAAGVLGLTGASLKRVWGAGAGGVITKSVSTGSIEGYPGPRIVQVPCGLLNAIGLSNPGVKNILEEIKTAKEAGATVIASVFGENDEDFAAAASGLEKSGIDAVELNLSCPHAGTLITIGCDPELTSGVVQAVKGSVRVPVWVKLPGNTHIPGLIKVAKSAENAGADGLTLINTLPAMALDIHARRAILGHGICGLSGPAIKPIALRLVHETRRAVEIPIMGSGGILAAEDAIEYFFAGASAIQIGTGTMYKGIEIFGKVNDGIRSFMEREGFEKVGEMVGLAHSS